MKTFLKCLVVVMSLIFLIGVYDVGLGRLDLSLLFLLSLILFWVIGIWDRYNLGKWRRDDNIFVVKMKRNNLALIVGVSSSIFLLFAGIYNVVDRSLAEFIRLLFVDKIIYPDSGVHPLLVISFMIAAVVLLANTIGVTSEMHFRLKKNLLSIVHPNKEEVLLDLAVMEYDFTINSNAIIIEAKESGEILVFDDLKLTEEQVSDLSKWISR